MRGLPRSLGHRPRGAPPWRIAGHRSQERSHKAAALRPPGAGDCRLPILRSTRCDRPNPRNHRPAAAFGRTRSRCAGFDLELDFPGRRTFDTGREHRLSTTRSRRHLGLREIRPRLRSVRAFRHHHREGQGRGTHARTEALERRDVHAATTPRRRSAGSCPRSPHVSPCRAPTPRTVVDTRSWDSGP